MVTPVPPGTPSAQPSPPATPPKPVVKAPDFHTEVRAVLESTCISCHGTDDQKGGLRLDTLAFAKEGGDSGPALVPGNKIESILLERIHLPADDDEIMPPKTAPSPLSKKTFSIAGLKPAQTGQRVYNLKKLRNVNLFFAPKQGTSNLFPLKLIHPP